jgi:dTDP-4-dehydrorhamnose 3,5-epimerase
VKFIPTEMPGVILVEPQVFRDARGFFLETYQQRKFAEGGINVRFVQDNHSRSSRGTLRGLHLQRTRMQGKLIRAVQGEIYDVAVDVRRNSPYYRKWLGVTLSAENFLQLYIPPGFAHGFCVISETAEIEYKCTDYYAPEDELTVLWNDPSLGIDWPASDPLLSAKDRAGRTLDELEQLLPRFEE